MNKEKMLVRIKSYYGKIKKIMNVPEMKLLPGNIAHFVVLSIIPVFVIISYSLNYFGLPIDGIVESLRLYLPGTVSDLLIPSTETGMSLGIGVWMATALLLASNGLHSIIVSADTLYGFKHLNYGFRRGKALLLTLLLVTVIIVYVILMTFLNSILDNAAIPFLYQFLKWTSIAAALFLTVKIIYIVTPRKRIPSKFTNYGSLFTSAGWIIATLVYSFYIKNYSSFETLYGGLTNIIVLIMWVYILSYIFIIGMSINVYMYRADNIND